MGEHTYGFVRRLISLFLIINSYKLSIMETNKLIEKYTYRVEWSEEDKLYVARCPEFPSLAAHGSTVEDALKEIEKVVDIDL